jgi:arylformamidase
MKIYDLSKELFSAETFPGDPIASKKPFRTISDDSPCNLTVLSIGSHNGTHMDAPRHFIPDGKGMDKVDLSKCIGYCKVIDMDGEVKSSDIEVALADGTKRLIIKGNVKITQDAAQQMADMELWFLGIQAMTVGDPNVHRTLLGKEIVILESAVLDNVPVGQYFLVSQPLKMHDLDGSPVRPILIDFGNDREAIYGD